MLLDGYAVQQHPFVVGSHRWYQSIRSVAASAVIASAAIRWREQEVVGPWKFGNYGRHLQCIDRWPYLWRDGVPVCLCVCAAGCYKSWEYYCQSSCCANFWTSVQPITICYEDKVKVSKSSHQITVSLDCNLKRPLIRAIKMAKSSCLC